MIVMTRSISWHRARRSWFPKNWARQQPLADEKVIVGTTFEIEGMENLPEGGYILAPKHQSFWDTTRCCPG
jgi:1-acyl-sn-glycerol-3-phosphate acyltransferase